LATGQAPKIHELGAEYRVDLGFRRSIVLDRIE
jgi:hypothetical protein